MLSINQFPHDVVDSISINAVNLQLLLRFSRAWHSSDTKVLDSLDGCGNSSANSIVNSAFGVMLFHNDHVSAHCLDVCSQAFHVQRFQ